MYRISKAVKNQSHTGLHQHVRIQTLDPKTASRRSL